MRLCIILFFVFFATTLVVAAEKKVEQADTVNNIGKIIAALSELESQTKDAASGGSFFDDLNVSTIVQGISAGFLIFQAVKKGVTKKEKR